MSEQELVGRVLAGRYRVTHLLGRGGMGAVYEAVQLDLNRRVAIKVLVGKLADDHRSVERFRREAEAAAAIGHPNIVLVTDFSERPGEPSFLVMEILSGEPLDRLLREGPLPPERARALMAQVLGALEAAHSAGIVHRDLKPSNVFVTPLGGGHELVKLLDFGIAKLHEGSGFERLTATGAFVGTTRYAAPEQIDGRPVDSRADVYSAGVLFYRMLCGRPPFVGESAQVALQVLTTEAPDPRTFVRDLDPSLVAVIARAMRKSPADRYSSIREMATALGAASPRPSSEPIEPLRKAILRPKDGAAPAPVAPTVPMQTAPARPPVAPTVPMQGARVRPVRQASAARPLLPWAIAAAVLIMFMGGICSLPVLLNILTRDSDKPEQGDIEEPEPVPARDEEISLPSECEDLREVACDRSSLANCTHAAVVRGRLRAQLRDHPERLEAAREECRREADAIRRR